MNRILQPTVEAFYRFNDDDGWAVASHIALSALMAFFPFLIVVTAIAAALFGSKELADETARILLEAWPDEVAMPIAQQVHDVMTNLRTDALTAGVVLSLFFSSSGIESLRIGLNRAYGVKESRAWWVLRLESIGYVLIGAAALLALSFLIVLYPLIWTTAVRYMPGLARFDQLLNFVRLGAAVTVLIVALLVAHLWLPAGRRRLTQVLPGIAVTLVLWLAAGTAFGRYLAEFAYTYVTYYAGLASVMIALVFLYLVASIFVYGGELNAAIARIDPPPPVFAQSQRRRRRRRMGKAKSR